MNLLIPPRWFGRWHGGANYLKNLAQAITTVDPTVTLVKFDEGAAKIEPEVQWNRSHKAQEISRFTVPWFRDRILGRMSFKYAGWRSINPWLEQVDVTFQVHHHVINWVKPSLKWYADFQHLHLPELFTKDELTERNGSAHYQARSADIVLVSSNQARDDFSDLCYYAAEKCRVLNFVADVPDAVWTLDRDAIRKKYDLPEVFFYVPNQFWKHKNHEQVILALGILKQRGKKACVVMSGNAEDYRHADHFGGLKKLMNELGVADQVKLVGVVPYLDVLGLGLASRAIINPSKFEGWSTTVEEAKTLGKEILLSSIPVHIEQAPEFGSYFPLDDPGALADLIEATGTKSEPAIDVANLQESLAARKETFGRTFLNYTREACVNKA